jgi:TetR/AcrR family transcriptional regulator, mexJK operon transcriptional repressor
MTSLHKKRSVFTVKPTNFIELSLFRMITESHDSKRQMIIAAATRMFLTHGYSKVSMDKIAADAPVSKATLYHYFSGKEALFAEVISRLCSSVLQTVNQVTVQLNNIENNLTQIAGAFVDLIFTEQALAMYRLVIAESHYFPELGRLVYKSSALPLLARLENYLQQLCANGLIEKVNFTQAADVFFSLLKGDLHFQCLLGTKPPPDSREKQQLVNHAVHFYLQGVIHVKA